MQMLEISLKTKTPLEEVPDRLSSAIEEKESISREINTLKIQAANAKIEVDDILSKKKVVIENIDTCVQVENNLNPLGLTLTDLPKVIRLVKNMSNWGHDPAKVAKLFAYSDDLEKKNENLEGMVRDRQKLKKELDNNIGILNKFIYARQDLAMSLENLTSLGFTSEMMKELANKLRNIATARSLPLRNIATEFLSHIQKYYDNILGFEAVLSQLQKEVEKKTRELDAIQTDCAVYKEAIDSRIRLIGRSVQDKHLIYWSNLFNDYPSLQPHMLTDSLKKYCDIQTAVNNLKIVYENLEGTIESQKIELDSLQKKIKQLLLELEQIKKTIVEEKNLHMIEFFETLKRSREFLLQTSETTIIETARKAFLIALDFVPGNSPLLPILKYQNGGKLPEEKEVIIATSLLINLLLRYLKHSDPLRTELERVANLIDEIQGIVVRHDVNQVGPKSVNSNIDTATIASGHLPKVSVRSANEMTESAKHQEETLSKDHDIQDSF
jgi:peptidoglycan hydrolase CwlO-like protein